MLSEVPDNIDDWIPLHDWSAKEEERMVMQQDFLAQIRGEIEVFDIYESMEDEFGFPRKF